MHSARHAFSQLCIQPVMHSTSYAFSQLCIQPVMHSASYAFGQLCIRPVMHLASYAFGQLCIQPVMHSASYAFSQYQLCIQPVMHEPSFPFHRGGWGPRVSADGSHLWALGFSKVLPSGMMWSMWPMCHIILFYFLIIFRHPSNQNTTSKLSVLYL